MKDDQVLQSPCPYCLVTGVKLSKDHIFPQFLGGSKKIICCKICNERFGQSFEAIASKTLHSLHIFISGWGVPLRSVNPTWRNAFTQDNETFNLSIGEKGLISEPSKPTVEFYDDGRFKRGKYRSKEEAEKAVQNLRDKGKASENLRIEEVPSQKKKFPLSPAIEIGPDIRRLALKMCIGLSTFLPNFDLAEINEARLYLNGDRELVPVNNVLVSFDSYDEINSNRLPLSHIIYVERNKSKVYGLVQYFGVFQLFCHLGSTAGESQDFAWLATLDPVSGNEIFSEISPIGLSVAPYFYAPEEFTQLVENWVIKLGNDAMKRGLNPSGLKMSSVDF